MSEPKPLSGVQEAIIAASRFDRWARAHRDRPNEFRERVLSSKDELIEALGRIG